MEHLLRGMQNSVNDLIILVLFMHKSSQQILEELSESFEGLPILDLSGRTDLSEDFSHLLSDEGIVEGRYYFALVIEGDVLSAEQTLEASHYLVLVESLLRFDLFEFGYLV
jgi:hypothetical protein